MANDNATVWGGNIRLGREPANNELLLGNSGGGFTLTPSSSLPPPDIQSLLDGISSIQGSILYRDASDWVALAPGVAGQFLQTNGAGANPSWQTVSNAKVVFGAYNSVAQSVGAAWTQLAFDTEEFDTNNNFASNAFTPTVGGYYQLNAAVTSSLAASELAIALYKNGSVVKNGVDADYGYVCSVSSLIYANGTTDSFTIYCRSGTTQNMVGGQSKTYFNGALITT